MFGFPLLLIPLAVCNIIVFLMRDVGFDAQLFQVPLPSGASWKVALGDGLLALALLLLLLEVQKSARPGGKYVTDHLLSLLIFGGAAAEWLMLPQFANSTFFLLTLIAMVDFLSGLALRGRRPKRLRETVLADPLPPPAPLRDPEPQVTVPPAPRPVDPARPVETLRPVEVLHVEPSADAEPVPPRVEPIIDVDPVLDDPKPVKPPTQP